MNITLSQDRLVSLNVTDKHGERYNVSIEFLNHHFQEDEVNVSVVKLSNKSDRVVFLPNRILHNEKVVAQKKEGYICTSVWFEFHPVDDLPAVKSYQ
jgi:hypothetical protein